MQGEKKKWDRKIFNPRKSEKQTKNSVLKKVENQQLEYHIQVTFQEMWKTVPTTLEKQHRTLKAQVPNHVYWSW